MLNTLLRYYRTLKYLKPKQLYGQFYFRFLNHPKVSPTIPPPPLRRLTATWLLPISKARAFSGPDRMTFLHEQRDISSPGVWNDRSIDKLWRYHLHYFDVLNSADAATHPVECQKLMIRWIEENPPAFGDGFEPYPLSLRIVNWIKWLYSGQPEAPSLLASVAMQVRYLAQQIEIHLLGNHILANAKALIFAGLFFRGAEAETWLKKGLKIFHRELDEQILADGAHIELSPMYHAIVLEDLLDIIHLYHAHTQLIPAKWIETIKQMFRWLRCMCHDDQDIAFFNDTTLGIAPRIDELERYAERLSLSLPGRESKPLTYFPQSGYARIKQGPLLLIADMAAVGAAYQPGHAHADTLSFELSLCGERVIVNSGISTYNATAERERQRGTKAHNTLLVDNQDSSEVWKSFRVGQRANIVRTEIINQPDHSAFTASHDGYYPRNKIIHTRTWSVTAQKILIEDHLLGSGQPLITRVLHFHPQIKITVINPHTIALANAQDLLLGTLVCDQPIHLENSTYHPFFNVAIANKMLLLEKKMALPVRLQITIQWS